MISKIWCPNSCFLYSDTPAVSSNQQKSSSSNDLLGELGDFMGAPVSQQTSSANSSQPLQSTQQVKDGGYWSNIISIPYVYLYIRVNFFSLIHKWYFSKCHLEWRIRCKLVPRIRQASGQNYKRLDNGSLWKLIQSAATATVWSPRYYNISIYNVLGIASSRDSLNGII